MEQPDYGRYTLEDFLFDDDFRQWVTNPDAEQTLHWQRLGRQHPHLVPLMEQARGLIPAVKVNVDTLPVESKQRIWSALNTRFEEVAAGRQVAFRPSYRRVWAVAASVALLILTAGWWLLVRPSGTETVRTNYGETRTVTLPDGSEVKLNGNSMLRFARTWDNKKAREVWLEGEGFFRVRKKQTPDGSVKFVAHTAKLDISVLGTQFNVNSRHGQTAVTLVEGKVQLMERSSPQRRVIELRPGQQARLEKKEEGVRVARVRTELHDAWTRDQFVFESTPLFDIGAMLHDTYGLEIVFADEALADKRFTGNLSRQNLETLLEVLAATYDLEVVRTDQRVEFRPKP
ncbi:FecR family protein [Tellurirhabdus rosea]|uniref:FecR family protein n=1 Tax=Tellurirhabdus rosea TaxID=2674997 RepID=UPI0022516B80|nr:FecR domain-containing protein [Tellurirhabdus rosea]